MRGVRRSRLVPPLFEIEKSVRCPRCVLLKIVILFLLISLQSMHKERKRGRKRGR